VLIPPHPRAELLDPVHIQHAFISPRQRAQKTFKLLFQGSELPPYSTEEGIQEWDYGAMEGKTAATIRAEFGATWDIWKDGCVGGESAQEMSDRCDRVRLAPRAVRAASISSAC
jgi:broad specificity phosphatase PhoE